MHCATVLIFTLVIDSINFFSDVVQFTRGASRYSEQTLEGVGVTKGVWSLPRVR